MTAAAYQAEYIDQPAPMRDVDESRPRNWGFATFILLNAVFFLRPVELLELDGWNIYEWTILTCALISLPAVLAQFSLNSLATCPMTAFVVAIWACVTFSHLPAVEDSCAAALSFAKIVLYYGLLVTLIDSPDRLRTFLTWIALFISALAVLPLLQHYGFINLEAMTPVADSAWDPVTRSDIRVMRLSGPGVFHDPNDLCHILSVGAILCFHAFTTRRRFFWRIFWCAMLALTIQAMILTQSRGGLIALMAGGVALIWRRFGWRKTLAVAVVGALALLNFSVRQTEFSPTQGTGETRVQLWSSALILFRAHPLLGVGEGHLTPLIGHVAHNSFIQCYAELGWFGGTAFLGAFAMALLWFLPRSSSPEAESRLGRAGPPLFAMVMAYIGGMLSLSDSYQVTPYMLLGVATAFHRLESPGPRTRFANGPFFLRLIVLSGAFLLAAHLFVRLTFHE